MRRAAAVLFASILEPEQRSMITTAIYTPISLNRQFATQCLFLARSLERNAAFPGPWKLVITISRDAAIGLDGLGDGRRAPVQRLHP